MSEQPSEGFTGPVALQVHLHDGAVVIHAGENDMAMSPDMAHTLGLLLLNTADRARGGAGGLVAIRPLAN